MTEPRRLLDGEATRLESVLLAAGRSEVPPPDVSARMAAALGLGSGPSFIGDLAGPGAASGGGAGLASGGASASLVLKWLGGLVAAAGLAAGGLTLVAGGEAPVAEGEAPLAEGEAPLVEGEAPLAEGEQAPGAPLGALEPAEAEPAEVSVPASEPSGGTTAAHGAQSSAEPEVVSERGERPSAPRVARSVGSKKPATKASVGDVAAEVKLLDAARSAVERGDRSAALEALRRYDGRFPEGVLRKEAAQLRQAVRSGSPSGSTRASREP